MPEPTQDDRNKLVAFLNEPHAFLDGMIRKGSDQRGAQIIPAHRLVSLQAAWREFNEQFFLARAEQQIRATQNERLVWAGLYGEQLSLKLSLIDTFKQRFLSFGGR